MIIVDGVNYNVDVDDIDIDGQFLYKYAERTEDGDLKSEGIGFFENQSITIRGDDNSDFIELYRVLSLMQPDGTFNHTINVFSPLGEYNAEMYPDKLRVNLKMIRDTKKYWGTMTIKFTAVSKKE